jgi:hypothetical protein
MIKRPPIFSTPKAEILDFLRRTMAVGSSLKRLPSYASVSRQSARLQSYVTALSYQ